MKTTVFLVVWGALGLASAAPVVDEAVFGQMLGGWTEKDERAAKYEVSGSEYLTWKPHVSPTLDGGIYVSVRIDHRRGMLASDDHASLELSFDGEGNVASARSTIALQGRKISSDLIEGGVKAGSRVAGVEQAAKVGTDLIGNLSAKLLREKVSEPGRVGFPAVLRHNYNLLILSVRQADDRAMPTGGEGSGLAVRAVPVEEDGEGETATPGAPQGDPEAVDPEIVEPVESTPVEDAGETGSPEVPPLEVEQHGEPRKVELLVPPPRSGGAVARKRVGEARIPTRKDGLQGGGDGPIPHHAEGDNRPPASARGARPAGAEKKHPQKIEKRQIGIARERPRT